jgi:hypothetical protein
MNKLLAFLFALSSYLAQAQISKNSLYISGSFDFDKSQAYQIAPLVAYFLTDRDAVGLTYNYQNRPKLIETTLIESKTQQWSVFYRRFCALNSNTYLLFEGNIGFGYGKGVESGPNTKLQYSGLGAGFQAGFLWFLTPGLSAEIIPFSVSYNQSHYKGDTEIKTQNIDGQYSIGNKLGLNIHILNPGKVLDNNPQDLIDKKVISGRLLFSQRKNELAQNNTTIGIAPQLDIFMTNWIQVGTSLTILSENNKGYNIVNQTYETASNVSFQLGPRIKVYKWLSQTTGVFAQSYLEGAFVFRQFNSAVLNYDNKFIDSYGGLNIGFSSFLSDRLLLEASTTVYSFEKNRFSPNLSNMSLSVGWLMK